MTQWLVLNAGSSSLKFALYADAGAELVRGAVSGIGHRPRLRIRTADGQADEETLGSGPIDMDAAAALVFDRLDSGPHGKQGISAVGHRIVHGGQKLAGPARLDGPTLDYLSPRWSRWRHCTSPTTSPSSPPPRSAIRMRCRSARSTRHSMPAARRCKSCTACRAPSSKTASSPMAFMACLSKPSPTG